MGTTVLLYGESNATSVLLSNLNEAKINDPAYKLGIRRLVLAEVVKQMSGFQDTLNNVLTESGGFNIYSANLIVETWQSTNPKLLDHFYKTTSVESVELPVESNHAKNPSAESLANTKEKLPTDESDSIILLSAESAGALANKNHTPHKFVVLGWVDNIHEHENRTPIVGSNKTAILYNLDIQCEYRMINPETNKVVAVFVAAGHGGIARILGAGAAPINYDVKAVVNDMFYSLAQNVQHNLQLREDQYVKNRDNAAKVNARPSGTTK